MTDRQPRRWNLLDLAASAIVAFLLLVAAAMMLAAFMMREGMAVRAAFALIAASLAAAVMTWRIFLRHWLDVRWNVGFGTFVSEPEPPYPEARLAWLWARRLRVAGAIYLAIFVLTAVGLVTGVLN